MTKADMYWAAMAVRHAAETLVDENDPGPAADYTLNGACGDVSMAFAEIVGLVDLYEEGDYQTDEGKLEGHCWLRDPDGWVWDLTATQFNDEFPPILIIKEPTKHLTDIEGKKAIASLDYWGDAEWRNRLKVLASQLLKTMPYVNM
jgi:hypothetical protein